jgi:hypothetical protein
MKPYPTLVPEPVFAIDGSISLLPTPQLRHIHDKYVYKMPHRIAEMLYGCCAYNVDSSSIISI